MVSGFTDQSDLCFIKTISSGADQNCVNKAGSPASENFWQEQTGGASAGLKWLYLLGAEGGAQRADGFSILLGFLLQLEELGRLDQRFHGLHCSALVKVFSSKPLFKLTYVVPEPQAKRKLC